MKYNTSWLSKALDTKKIDINSTTHDIVMINPSNDSGNYGSVFYTKALIEINQNLKQSAKEATLLHEIIHVISTDSNLELNETQVSNLAITLYNILSEAPNEV